MNRFSHPCEEVLELVLNKSEGGLALYRTDEQGAIEFITDGVQMWVETER